MTKVEYCFSIQDGEGQGAIAIDRVLPESEVPDGLAIYFCRTIRVPEPDRIHYFDAKFGFFDLHKGHDYLGTPLSSRAYSRSVVVRISKIVSPQGHGSNI